MNPALIEPVQRLLSDDLSSVRAGLASNPALTTALQRRLSDDASVHVRQCLAANPALCAPVERRLAVDQGEDVRWSLAERPSLLRDVGLLLASDANADVRRSLARNRSVALHAEMPVAFLRESPRGRELLEPQLSRADAAARSALEPSWEGTLEELLVACDSFALGAS